MTSQEIAATLRYCWEHTDNADEEAMVRWVAEKFAERMYSDPHGPKGAPKVDAFVHGVTGRHVYA